MLSYADLFDGTQLSDCPLPCTTTYTETKHLFDRTVSNSNISTLLLTVSSKVLVTRTDFPEFSLASFLSEVGGSMGLWLGLGMVQVMERLLTPYCLGSHARLKQKLIFLVYANLDYSYIPAMLHYNAKTFKIMT